MWLSELALFLRRKKRDVFNAEAFEEENTSKFVLEIKDLSVWRADDGSQLLRNVNLKIPEFCIVSIIGPSGSGKSSLLKSINGVNFEGRKCSWEGEIKYKGLNVLTGNIPFDYLRTHIGTVLQKPVVFPMSISENVLFALKARGLKDSRNLGSLLEKTLRDVYLWDEVKNRLDSRPEDALSIGQQQRLCIARAVALRPKILLMDEPTSALDSKSSRKIEELVRAIVRNKISTIVFVSHSLSQVKRISDYVVFIDNGSIVESGRTSDIFNNPKMASTREFISEAK